MVTMTRAPFSIELVDGWSPATGPVPELSATSALLRITIGDRVITRNEDERSRSVHDAVGLSAYPLALWFASSWWRLQWEPRSKGMLTTSWKMAHCMPAAGYGYIWPPVMFQSDGERIAVSASPTEPVVTEPVRFLSQIDVVLEAGVFERAIDDFVALVLNRLDAVGLGDNELQNLWAELSAERDDLETAIARRIEATLGFDPDAAPDQVMDRLLETVPQAGAEAIAEIAAACAGPDPEALLDSVLALREQGWLTGRNLDLRQSRAEHIGMPPARERGPLLARDLRRKLGVKHGRIIDKELSDLLGLGIEEFRSDRAPRGLKVPPRPPGAAGSSQRREAPCGLAIREAASNRLRLAFRSDGRHRSARRWEAARFVADQFIAPSSEDWLPVTEATTARQNFQRAFAAELLCPTEYLLDRLRDDFSNDAVDRVADEFGLPPLAVRAHLEAALLMPLPTTAT